MKKFSNVTGQKIGTEPKEVVKSLNEEELFKSKVVDLMDNLLSVRTYGPVDRYERAGLIKVTGKEMFLEALMDLLKDKSLKEEVKLLESLKGYVTNWEAIDSKIEETQVKIDEVKSKDKMIPHRNKLKSLYSSYGNDEETLMIMVEESCKKITDSEKAHLRAVTAEYMANEGKYPKSTFEKIAEKYNERSQQLSINS